MNKKKTLVVNLFAGPGTGKSTTAAAVFANLKWNKVNCELVTEFAKDLVWERRQKTITNQIYLFGKQHHKIFRLLDEVDVVITDSPILLTPIYDPNKSQHLLNLALEEHHRFNNLNIFLNRVKEYNPKGRNQTHKEAIAIDNQILKLLNDHKITHRMYDAEQSQIERIVSCITNKLD